MQLQRRGAHRSNINCTESLLTAAAVASVAAAVVALQRPSWQREQYREERPQKLITEAQRDPTFDPGGG
jgi:hypothetical protein